jgi:hypothetical protein
MRLQKLEKEPSTIAPVPASKKRKASDEEEGEDTIRKRIKPISTNGLPEGFFDPGSGKEPPPATHAIEMQIPSRPATPSKPTEAIPTKKPEPQVDEDEWAAFEADIATAEAQVQAANDAVILAPAMSAEDIMKKTAEEEYNARKERQEAEIEGDKEDAARKMEEELEEMESLEVRVRRLREKREELRKKESLVVLNMGQPTPKVSQPAKEEDEEDDEEDEDEDEWFR